MALPLIAAGIAARAVAKKLVTRAAGGITGSGAKMVNPTYRNMETPPKPPTSSSIPKKEPHVSETRPRPRNENLNPPKKPVTPNGTGTKRGSFSGDLGRYNWKGN